MNIDERISKLRLYLKVEDEFGEVTAESVDEVKQLIRDVVVEVTPEPRPEYKPGTTTDGQMMQVVGYNRAIKIVESKAKELLD